MTDPRLDVSVFGRRPRSPEERQKDERRKAAKEAETPGSEERFKNFQSELKAVLNKYNGYISACGCCGSPWVGIETSEGDTLHEVEGSLKHD